MAAVETPELVPAPSVWMITMLVRYNFSPVPHIVTIPAHVRLNGDGLEISNTIRTWTEWDGQNGIIGELMDWCLTEYAPIPF